ncbi:MAG: hypothetical protein ACJAYF_003450 [Arenicella sp.]|jgi:hypothetical protein
MFKLEKRRLLSLLVLFALSTHSYAAIAGMQNQENTITVARSGGDFTSLEEAINSIDKAGERNRYLILVGPGSFKILEPIEMKRWVSISGRGKNVTRLQGATGDDNRPLFHGSRDSNISNLEIKMGMNSTNRSNTAIRNFSNGCPDLQNVAITIKASSGISPTALSSDSGCSFVLDNVDISVNRSRGGRAVAIASLDSFKMRNSRVTANIAIAAEDNSFTVNASRISGLIETYDADPSNTSGKFYDSILQSANELVVTQSTQIEGPLPLFFTRCSFITPNGLPEFAGNSDVSCTLSDNDRGSALNSNCAVTR